MINIETWNKFYLRLQVGLIEEKNEINQDQLNEWGILICLHQSLMLKEQEDSKVHNV